MCTVAAYRFCDSNLEFAESLQISVRVRQFIKAWNRWRRPYNYYLNYEENYTGLNIS